MQQDKINKIKSDWYKQRRHGNNKVCSECAAPKSVDDVFSRTVSTLLNLVVVISDSGPRVFPGDQSLLQETVSILIPDKVILLNHVECCIQHLDHDKNDNHELETRMMLVFEVISQKFNQSDALM